VRSERPPPERGVTGVCHITATAEPDMDVTLLVVRLVMTHDVEAAQAVTRHAIGPDEACRELRHWMDDMCAPGRQGS
jgi:hypothetical protein